MKVSKIQWIQFYSCMLIDTDLPPKTFPFTSMGQLSLEPRTGVDTASLERPVFDHTKSRVTDWIRKNTEIADAIAKAKEEAAAVDMSEKFAGENVQVITLGTGSSIPSKYRNGKYNVFDLYHKLNHCILVSATMVKLPDNQGSIMLDAGEGTYGQMMRRFGEDKVDDELKNLRCIFVSHLHADHHLGVIHLLTKWWEVSIVIPAVLAQAAQFEYSSTKATISGYMWWRLLSSNGGWMSTAVYNPLVLESKCSPSETRASSPISNQPVSSLPCMSCH